MIAYCWANGLIGFGKSVPDGAIFIAEGCDTQVREVISAVARHGKGVMHGALLVPGVPEAKTQQAKGDALGAWLAWCAQHTHLLRWGGMDEAEENDNVDA